uniref:Transposase domain-containing protein n=1 Tax=Photinus pyralis TaxID=7054 RepID=A0A1Y1K4M3_PHOPY
MYKQRSKRQLARIIRKNVEATVRLAEVDSISDPFNATLFSKKCTVVSNGNAISMPNTYEHEAVSETDDVNNPQLDDTINDIGFNACESGDHASVFADKSVESYDDDCNSLSSTSSSTNSHFHKPEETEISTVQFLTQWSLKNNITHIALTELLKWFSTNPDINSLPKDARTLLQTPISASLAIEELGVGQFYYFGMRNKLQEFIISQAGPINSLMLQFNIDGMQVFKSKNTSFWPILCMINGPVRFVFPVAIYCGSKKPPLQDYLEKFVNELISLINTGLTINGKLINIQIEAFCCDTPARSYIKNVKGHNAVYGCDKCMSKGVYYNRRRIFQDLNADLRTNDSFVQQINQEYHKGLTPLMKLPIDLITAFPLDYMHCVCLGVMRKLLFLWRDGPRTIKLKNCDLEILNNRLIQASHMWPSDFNRKPRSLSELERWKAIELRQFLLYLGPVLLKNLLPTHVYCNFSLLHFAITILLNDALNVEYNEYAGKLLKLFVQNSVKIYGREFCIYNVHTLIHLANDSKNHRNLGNVNCFPFENYLGSIKKMLRKSNLPLQQVVHRLMEKNKSFLPNTMSTNVSVGFISRSTFLVPDEIKNKFNGFFYTKYQFPSSIVSCKEGNNCIFLKSDEIIQVHCFVSDELNVPHIIGKKYSVIRAFTEYPTSSCLLNLYEVKLENDQDFLMYPCYEFLRKGLIVRFNEILVCMPLFQKLKI